MTTLDDAEHLVPATGWREVLGRFWPLTRGRRTLIGISVLLYSLATLGDAVSIVMLSDLVDGALASGDLARFWRPAGIWAVVVVAATLATYLASLLTTWAAESFGMLVRAGTYAHLLSLSPEALDRRPTGDLLSRVVDDVEEVEGLVVTGVVDAFACAVGVVVFGTAAWLLSWKLALIVLAGAPTVWLFNRWLGERTRRTSMQVRRRHGDLTTVLEQGLGNAALVQTYTGQRAESRRLARTASRFVTARMRQQRIAAVQGPVTELIETIGMLAVLAVGVSDIAAGSLTVGGLLAFTAYLGFLYPAVTGLGQLGIVVAAAGTSATRLGELLDEQPAVQEPLHRVAPPRPRGELVVRDVSVHDPDGRVRLPAVSFTVSPGEILAVTGPSGAGKSTLVQVLTRLRDPSSGAVLLDGVDLRRYPLGQLHRAITVLPQESFMFDDSVRANLVYGLRRDDHELGPPTGVITPVTRAAGAEEFLARMPQGLRIRIGNRGRSLSGGQRQRIAIARALLREGVVLVLDEPSTGLDAAATEALVVTLREQARSQAVIVVTHDPILAAAGDRVLLLGARTG